MAAVQCYTVEHETESSFHSDEVINFKLPRWPAVTNTSLFTLLLQAGFSSAMPCMSLQTLLVCSVKLLLPRRLYFGLFIPFTFLTVSLPLVPQEKNLEWFPRMRAMSLVSSEGDNEQNEMRSLQEKLDNTVTLVAQLSGQLAELKEQV